MITRCSIMARGGRASVVGEIRQARHESIHPEYWLSVGHDMMADNGIESIIKMDILPVFALAHLQTNTR